MTCQCPSIPKFVWEGAAKSYELRNRDTGMKEDDDDRPKKKITHEIGQDLYLLSVKEIERLKASIASKQSSRGVADSLFKK